MTGLVNVDASKTVEALGGALDALFTSDEERAAGAVVMEKLRQRPAELLQALNLGQLEVNKVEAASPRLFVSGWRPAVGWVCVVGLAYSFILQPLLQFVLVLADAQTCSSVINPAAGGAVMECRAIVLPSLDSTAIVGLVLSMLGLAGVRGWEKKQGVAAV